MGFTRKKLCASCLKFNFNKTIKSSKKHHPKWLNKINYVEHFINSNNNFSNHYPNNYNKILKIFIGKDKINNKILYWGAKPSSNLIINDAKTAYGNFNNSGVANVDKNGYALIKFNTPQNYKTIAKNSKNFTTFFKHIHYVISNKENNKWINTIYTKLIHNNYNYKSFIKKLNGKCAIILNVLPSDMYAKDHIKETYNLPYDNIKKMSINQLNIWFNEIINLHYPKIDKLLKRKKLQVYEIPIICYCAHNKCNASKIACENLMKKGYVNVSLYEDGMKGYNLNK